MVTVTAFLPSSDNRYQSSFTGLTDSVFSCLQSSNTVSLYYHNAYYYLSYRNVQPMMRLPSMMKSRIPQLKIPSLPNTAQLLSERPLGVCARLLKSLQKVNKKSKTLHTVERALYAVYEKCLQRFTRLVNLHL